MDMLKELMKKKGKKDDIDPTYKHAKMGVLKHISDMASGAMGEDIKGLKKVTVASSDREGLEDGLETAKKLVSKKGEALDTNSFETGDDEEKEEEHEASESPEQEEEEHEEDESPAHEASESASKEKAEHRVVKEHGGHAGMREALESMDKDRSPKEESEHSMLPDDMSDEEMDALMAEISKKRSKK
jgi:hypothetical protein